MPHLVACESCKVKFECNCVWDALGKNPNAHLKTWCSHGKRVVVKRRDNIGEYIFPTSECAITTAAKLLKKSELETAHLLGRDGAQAMCDMAGMTTVAEVINADDQR